MSVIFIGQGSNGVQVNFHCHCEGKDGKTRKSVSDKDKNKSSSSKMPHQDKYRSLSKKDKSSSSKPSSSKHPLRDKGVGYTHVIATLRLATLYSDTASADPDTDKSPWWKARLDTLEQALRNKGLYVPLAAGLRIPAAAAEVMERFNASFAAGDPWPAVLTRLEGELHGAGLVEEGADEDWTFHDSAGWHRWDAGTGGYVDDSGARCVYISKTGCWELLQPTPGVVDADAAEEDYVPGGLDADAAGCES